MGRVSGVRVALALAVLAGGPIAFAHAQQSPGKPAFYVQWTANPKGLTAKPASTRRNQLPDYPAESIKAKEAGETELEVCITTQGRLTDIRLKKSSGHPRLDQATIDWAKSVTYSPALFNGEAFAVCNYPLVYVWQLDGR